MNREIILASASPRRKELLNLIIENFKVIPSSVEEIIPETLVVTKVPEFLSELKALVLFNILKILHISCRISSSI